MIAGVATLLLAAAAMLAPQAQDEIVVYRASKVFTAEKGGMINNGAMAVVGSKIKAAATASEVMAQFPNAKVVDLGDYWLVPGCVEAHNHVAGSLRDLNDTVYLTNPALETHGVLEPQNPYLKDSIAGGITSALFIPGSGSNMGGFGMLVKTSGKTVEEMVVRSPGSLKIAQAGNPERYGFGVGRAMMNWNTRDTLSKGIEWVRAYRAGEVEWDPKWANFEGLVDRTTPVSVHTQIYQVVMQTIVMQKNQLGLAPFIDHGTFDGFKAGSLAVESGVPVMNGPREFWWDRSSARIVGNGAGWFEYVKDGLLLGYNTDAPVIPQEELPYQAAMGVRFGAGTSEDGLLGVTSHPAKALLIEDVAGSLKPGLDADFVVWTGNPIDPRSHVIKAYVRGELVYDSNAGRRY
ncbi:MAG: amidohydrolase family protein [Planctomycetes bacterium]|nr:amidohydrolase family protein [Planctomycetota bacterium]